VKDSLKNTGLTCGKNIKMTNKYLALIHDPIVNKNGEKVTTSVTNLDIHDIARSCRTFGFKNYYIVTPIKKQQELIKDILSFWKEDFANEYNPDRHDALSFIITKSSVQEVIKDIEDKETVKPIFAVTGANFSKSNGEMSDLKKLSLKEKRPFLLGFGTGWGLHREILETADFHVDPITGFASDGYNHLSVRSAVAIYTANS